MDLKIFLQENKYIDFLSQIILSKAQELLSDTNSNEEKAKRAFTLADDDSKGYCVHCYNAVFIDNKWIKVDARGNTNGKNAQFSLEKPLLAFSNRKQYNEYFWKGIYANPHADTMAMLENVSTIQDILEQIPDYVVDKPDIIE